MITVLSYIFQGIIMVIVVFSMELASFDVMRDNIIAGGFGFLGNLFANHATTKGYTGPASALTNVQVVLQVVIDALFLYQIPNGMQIAACLCGIFGSLTITMGPIIVTKIKSLF